VEDDCPPNNVKDEPQVKSGSATMSLPGSAVLKINTPAVAQVPVPSLPPIH
jgi:hypothetical protein